MGQGVWNEDRLSPKKPFVPYAVFNLATGCVRKIISKRQTDGKRFLMVDHGVSAAVLENTLATIDNPHQALDIFADVTGQQTMMEKIKAECKKTNVTNLALWHRTGKTCYKNYAASLANILHYIKGLEAETEKEQP